ncbi:MAG TPA: class I SAM-dependent methyltransferase [Candidatus Polarisedimenticolia bacterium]|nr:class I SAM-dependent methyltransferase [Candidatus Polarisedimenticolia bacterium]
MPKTETRGSANALRAATAQCYREYNAKKGVGRNDLLHNAEVLFQTLARDAAMVRAMQWIKASPESARVLDVGCGEGDSLWVLLRLGFEPANLSGVDIQEDKIIQAKATNPLVNFECADATSLAFNDGTFDIAMESMMFLQLTDDDVARRIASEMIRVTKPGGILLVSDWRYSKPGSKEFKGVSRKRIAALYQVGKQTRVQRTFRGALIPPVGRFLSKHVPFAYFAVHKLMPFLTGQVVTVLEKFRAS